MAQKSAADIAAEQAAKDADLTEAVDAVVKTETKRKTHEQRARDEQAAELAALEAESLLGCETFVVVHPKMNVYVGGDKDEIEVSVGTVKTFVDVVDGWATIPKNTQLRAKTSAELADFRMKVSLGFLSAIPAAPPAAP